MKCQEKNSIGLVVIYGEINVSLELFGSGCSCVGSSERFNRGSGSAQLLMSDRELLLGLLPGNYFVVPLALALTKLRIGLVKAAVSGQKLIL